MSFSSLKVPQVKPPVFPLASPSIQPGTLAMQHPFVPFMPGITLVPGASGFVPVSTINPIVFPHHWHHWHHRHYWNDYVTTNPYYYNNYQMPYMYQNYYSAAQPYGYPAAPQPAPETPAAPQANGQTTTVSMYDDYFVPAALEIKAGTTVTWKNLGSHLHSLTEPDSGWTSDNLQKGGAFSRAFTDPGTYVLVDPLHSEQMRMTIVVK
jgi:plastocyanin